jgi:plasmid stabilization system protein ParE
MTRYTVVWHRLAEEELADIWNQAADRAAVASAANSIDTALAVDAQQKGNSVSSRSRELTIPPLQVLFRVRINDRIVEVFSVAHV